MVLPTLNRYEDTVSGNSMPLVINAWPLTIPNLRSGFELADDDENTRSSIVAERFGPPNKTHQLAIDCIINQEYALTFNFLKRPGKLLTFSRTLPADTMPWGFPYLNSLELEEWHEKEYRRIWRSKS